MLGVSPEQVTSSDSLLPFLITTGAGCHIDACNQLATELSALPKCFVPNMAAVIEDYEWTGFHARIGQKLLSVCDDEFAFPIDNKDDQGSAVSLFTTGFISLVAMMGTLMIYLL